MADGLRGPTGQAGAVDGNNSTTHADHAASRSTIFALSSAPGRAGVAVIRLSGPRAHEVAAQMAGALPPVRTASLRRLVDPSDGDASEERLLDHALVLRFDAPHSFTGEDVVEFHVHGGRAVVDGVLSALATMRGLEPAEPGAFTRRAFDHGKLDLTGVEGLADLIDADTVAARDLALAQAGGSLRETYERWRTTLIQAQALTEAAIDFSDEADVSDDAFGQASALVGKLGEALRAHLADANRGEIIRSGYRVALTGLPNAGKSSLLNALVQRDAAIVAATPGTTRDVIEVKIDVGGQAVVLWDTAGVRETADEIERQGVERALARADDADLVLWLWAPGTSPRVPAALKALPVVALATKADVRPATEPGPAGGSAVAVGSPDAEASPEPPAAISVRTGEGMAAFTAWLAGRAAAATASAGSNAPPPTRPRHRYELQRVVAALEAFANGPADETELRAEDLRQAALALGRLTGRVDVEHVLDEIFGSFCIGK
ncbi:MAG: tRNA uridine-5-carboxymethylaminomethyl(34) synthesis GTPase MnmE [Pseudomonadota bacterium]